jgi:anti-sigma B factor antagonist
MISLLFFKIIYKNGILTLNFRKLTYKIREVRFEIEFIKSNPNVPVDYETVIVRIAILNKLDQSIAEQFELFIFALMKSGIKKFVLDLNELKYIDSSGIGKIINITKLLRKQNGNISMSRVSQEIMQVFKLVKLDTFIKIFLSVEEAVNYLRLS